MIIELARVALTYQSPNGEVEALRDISFGMQDGEFVSIVGPSGCGKSTLLALIAGLVAPTAGTVVLDGEPVTAPSPKIGFMPQRDQLFEWRTIWSNVLLGPDIRRENTPARQAHVRELLERYGLSEFSQKLPSQLSGGMRQRCALIRTLATEPRILLLDEPFSALDYQTRLSVSADIYRIIRQEQKTALLVTHDISEAISMSDRVLVLSQRPAVIRAVTNWMICARCLPLSGATHPPFAHISTRSGRSWISMHNAAPSPQRLAYLRARSRRVKAVLFSQLFLLFFFFGMWELSARLGWINAFIFSCPSRVASTLGNLQQSGDLWRHIGTSCLETVVGSRSERFWARLSPSACGAATLSPA
jgi:NitT/TauT family transport system ATP-binding protein